MPKTALLTAILLILTKVPLWGQIIPSNSVVIGNFLRESPNGIAWAVDNAAAFVIQPETKFTKGDFFQPSTAAPNGSYHKSLIRVQGTTVALEWGRVAGNVVGRITSEKATELPLLISSGWPEWSSTFSPTKEGATATAKIADREIRWELRMSPAPVSASAAQVLVKVTPETPVHFVAGLGREPLPSFPDIDGILREAETRYLKGRAQASGDWGDFVGVIADNVNNSRLYNSKNHTLAHNVSRGWANTPNGSPYFCWDSFLTANLAALDDPETARATVRTMLATQSPEGLVPNFAIWDSKGAIRGSMDRSQPPVGSWCVWKMHQRYPDDLDFLGVVYPKLVIWHDWWPKARDAKHDGLLEWGSETGGFQAAQYETGWDDNLHFATAQMVGKTMNCYAADLCAMWAMDAHYLALLADALGNAKDAERFRAEQTAMNQRINDRLWNANLQIYCSRFWDDAVMVVRVPNSAFGQGFDGEWFSDEELKTRVATQRTRELNFNWKGKSPLKELGDTHWSARWKATLTVPASGNYRFSGSGDDGIRVYLDGKCVIDDWGVHPARVRTAEVQLQKDQSVSISVEYLQHEDGSELHFAVDRIEPAHGAFLTRMTPMNFYPLISGAPDAERGKMVMGKLTDEKKFWGKYLLPTLAYDDPDWHLQHYWKGHVWGPVNYIVFEGLKQFATPGQIAEYADRNVDLFMKNWTTEGLCGENYSSKTGHQNSDPHYTWGALLCLVGLESIVDVDDQNRIVLNGTQYKTIQLANIPLLGRRYDVKASPGRAQLFCRGKVVLEAKGKIVHAIVP